MSDFRHTQEGDLLNYLLENVNVISEEKDKDVKKDVKKVPQTMQQQEEPVVDFEQQHLHDHEGEEKRVAKKDRDDAAREVKDKEVENEGIVPDTFKDSEKTVIKKLDEGDAGMLSKISAVFKSAVGMTHEETSGGPVYDMAMAAMGPNTTWEIQDDGILHGDSGEVISWDELITSSEGLGYQLYGMALNAGISEELGGGGVIEAPDPDYNADDKINDEEGYGDDLAADDELEESLTCCEICGVVHGIKELHECVINEEPMDSEDDYVKVEQDVGVGPSYVAMAQASTDATEAATTGGRLESTTIYADYKDTTGAFEQLVTNLPELGLYVIDDPDVEGSDMFGVKVSTVPWTADSIQASLRDMEDKDEIFSEEEVEEGIVPDTSKDSEETVIKKLDEADSNPRDSFLDSYKELCMKHNMIIVSESETPLQVVDITSYPTGDVPMDQFVVAHIEKHVELLRGTAIEMGGEVEVELPLDGSDLEEGCMDNDDGPVQEDDSDRDKAFTRIQAQHPEYSEEQVWKVVYDQNPASEPVAEEISDDDAEYDEIASLDDESSANDLARKEGGHVIKDEKNRKFRVIKAKDKGVV